MNESLQRNERSDFLLRHVGPSASEQAEMLSALGVASLDDLVRQVVPTGIRSPSPLELPEAGDEPNVLSRIAEFARSNRLYKSYIGMGYHGTHTPLVIQRNFLENPAWYTAYTPYQAEISQGRLEALLNFQTMVADLTAMDVANASLLDEATAAAEAMAFCYRLRKSQNRTFLVSDDCHPQTIEVVKTRAAPLGIDVHLIRDSEIHRAPEFFAVLLQCPGTFGDVRDYRELIDSIHHRGGLVAVAADLLALTLLTPPGEFGADVVIGTSQRFGLPLWYGGPHAAYFATRDAFKRNIPGRIVGVSVDSRGRPAYRLAIQAREQHIRREKATSNICTAQVLLANAAALYAVYHGPQGLKAIAKRVHALTIDLATRVEGLGYEIATKAYFDTVKVYCPARAEAIHRTAVSRQINLRRIDEDHLGISLDETTTTSDVDELVDVLATHAESGRTALQAKPNKADVIPHSMQRKSAFLTHPTFNSFHSETRMLRYLRRLADKDLALDRTMIPLGSCTMKLNAAAEMLPVTWPHFANLHPFVPAEQAHGYRLLINELEEMLCKITGYDAASLQPNAGSQGEYAGLLAIRAYHASRREGHRDVCLIPSSAHGTNPASAQMAGMEVVVVECDRDGNISIEDLRSKCVQYAQRLAAMMITYPSTHGVFEESVREVCNVVHSAGGQVYIDGANMNALVGLAYPGEFGGDVSHINLHKTFCIPHGGGGPGAGPIAAKAHLARFLPGHQTAKVAGIGAVSAAPFGSAGILPISWVYIMLLGATGLKRASEIAILNANYIAKKLEPHFPILYAGRNDRVAHECIIDLRPLKMRTGIEVEDVAKRLIDFGFHAPTVSFPVPGTLMIEPTESESKDELDRFINAMTVIGEEIRAIAEGRSDRKDNPLKNAPHTAADLVKEWTHSYDRERAVFPLGASAHGTPKYWAPVNRVDNVYGDRNVVCTCPPVSHYQDDGKAATGDHNHQLATTR